MIFKLKFKGWVRREENILYRRIAYGKALGFKRAWWCLKENGKRLVKLEHSEWGGSWIKMEEREGEDLIQNGHVRIPDSSICARGSIEWFLRRKAWWDLCFKRCSDCCVDNDVGPREGHQLGNCWDRGYSDWCFGDGKKWRGSRGILEIESTGFFLGEYKKKALTNTLLNYFNF